MTKPPRATLEQKVRILDHFHRLGRPQLETVDTFRAEVAILTLTFNEWLKHEPDLRVRYAAVNQPYERQARRKVKYKYDEINRAMDALVERRLARGEPVTEPILRHHWQVYARQYGVENPKRLAGFSHGWLGQFKKRHGLPKARDGALTTNNSKLLAEGEEKQAYLQDQAPSRHQLPSQSQSLSQGQALSQAQSLGQGQLGQSQHGQSQSLSQAQSLSQGQLGQGRAARARARNEKLLAPDQAQFRPQESLSFPQKPTPTPPLHDRLDRLDPAALASLLDLEPADLLQLAIQLARPNDRGRLALPPIDTLLDSQMAQFLLVADRFFSENHLDYPQTSKQYQDFRKAFASERLIALRTSRDPSFALDYPAHEPAPALAPQGVGQGQSLTLSKEPTPDLKHPLAYEEKGMDEIFRDKPYDLRSLRRIWEQNKMMLS